MNNVYHFESPGNVTYYGPAHKISIEFTTLRTGIGVIDTFAERIALGYVNSQIEGNNGYVLYTDIYNEESTYPIAGVQVPTYNWKIISEYYDVGATAKALPPIIIGAIVVLIAAIAIYIASQGVTDVIHGRKDQPPAPFFSFGTLVGIAIAALGIGYLYKLYKQK